MEKYITPIYRLDHLQDLTVYIKRDDLVPYSFGGNKVRKAYKFFQVIDSGQYDCVVTYGSGSSNHCRVVANMAAKRGIKCYIVSAEETADMTFNSIMTEQLFGAKRTVCPVAMVHDTIEEILQALKIAGSNPYFIPGGGHGNLGTEAYVDCYREIRRFEEENDIKFDYIFHASGTGTTQAGLVCGSLLSNDPVKIIGISIARKNPYGRNVVLESVRDYLSSLNVTISEEAVENAVIFDDSYVQDGYGKSGETVRELIKYMMVNHGIPMDSTYVGKACFGMFDHIKKNGIANKDILFIHTGGTPLFFNDLENMRIG